MSEPMSLSCCNCPAWSSPSPGFAAIHSAGRRGLPASATGWRRCNKRRLSRMSAPARMASKGGTMSDTTRAVMADGSSRAARKQEDFLTCYRGRQSALHHASYMRMAKVLFALSLCEEAEIGLEDRDILDYGFGAGTFYRYCPRSSRLFGV